MSDEPSKQWFCKIGEEQIGPFGPKEISSMASSGKLNTLDLVRRGDMDNWVRAETVKGLKFLEQSLEIDLPRDSEQIGTDSSDNSVNKKSEKPATPEQQASQQARVFDYIKKASSKHASTVIDDLRALNFMEEITPVNAHILALLKKDSVFWSVAFLAVVPLVLRTVQDIPSQLTGFCLFFAVIWGVVFKKFILEETNSWRAPVLSFFFTGLIGMNALLLTHRFLPDFYMQLRLSPNLIVMTIGSIVVTGFTEEFCKIVPVLVYIAWRRQNANPLTIVLVGVFSGLGFAAFENMAYADRSVETSTDLTKMFGAEGLKFGVQNAMINVMLRSMSLVFAHAIFSGTFSYFLAVAAFTRRRIVALAMVGLLVSSTLHGSYNALFMIQTTAPAVIILCGFVLFYSYLTRLRLLVASESVADLAAVTVAEGQ